MRHLVKIGGSPHPVGAGRPDLHTRRTPEGPAILFRSSTPSSPARRVGLAALALFSGLTGFAIVSAMVQNHALDARVSTLRQENARIRQQIDERRLQIGEAGSNEWLQEQARKLGFAFPGETVLILTSPGAAVPAGGGIDAPLPTYAPPTPVPSASASTSPTPVPMQLPVTFPGTPSPAPH